MIFEKGNSFFMPKDSGLEFGSLKDDDLRKLSADLTEAEKVHPHSKYLRKKIELPDEFMKAINGGPMDPSKAFLPDEYGKYMNTDGHCEVENGYCVLPNGVTYAAVLLRQEGRTDEMIDCYNRDFAPGGTLFYKLWCPGYHYLHYCNGAYEDFGFGRLNMKFAAQYTAEEMGISVNEIEKNDPSCIGIGATSTLGFNLDSDHPEAAEWNSIAFYHRQTEYGREVRVRLWYGYGVDSGKVILTPPPEEKAMEIAKKTMMHVMLEYSNDQYLETKFWNDTHK